MDEKIYEGLRKKALGGDLNQREISDFEPLFAGRLRTIKSRVVIAQKGIFSRRKMAEYLARKYL